MVRQIEFSKFKIIANQTEEPQPQPPFGRNSMRKIVCRAMEKFGNECGLK